MDGGHCFGKRGSCLFLRIFSHPPFIDPVPIGDAVASGRAPHEPTCPAAGRDRTRALAPSVAVADDPSDLPREELIRLGESATALVDLTASARRFAAALCVHSSGLFVTNVEPFVPLGVPFDRVRVVIRPGRPDQSVHEATVLCRLRELGLTLLRVDGAKGLVALPLGSPDEIDELMDVTAFDVPALPGPDWDQKKIYPSVHAGTGYVSAIQRQGGRPFRIQFDAPISPGGVGGPLLDAKGRVLGVVLSRVRAGAGEGVPLAVPVNRLDQFLNHAELTFTPPEVTAGSPSRPVRFRAAVRTFFPSKDPLEVRLILRGWSESERHFPMTLKDGAYEVESEPLADRPVPASVWLEAMYDDGTVSARFDDRMVVIEGVRPVRLGDIRLLRLGPRAVALLGNGTTIEGTGISGLGESTATVAGQALPLDLGRARMVRVEPPADYPAIACSVVVRRAGHELGRVTTPIYPADRVSPCLEAIRDGRFIRPAWSDTPVTYLTFEGGSRTRSIPGPSAAFGAGDLKVVLPNAGNHATIDVPRGTAEVVRRTNSYRGVVIETAPPARTDRWEFRFEAPHGQNLAAADYPHVRGLDTSGEAAEFRFAPPAGLKGYDWTANQNRGNSGRFVVWEIAVKEGKVERLAIDFVGKCETWDGIHLVKCFYGMLRYNSTFQ